MNENVIEMFSQAALDRLATVLSELCTHDELTRIFSLCKLDQEGHAGLPKRKRIICSLSNEQNRVGCGNSVLRLIREIVTPIRFVDQEGGKEKFDNTRLEVNKILLFKGLEYTAGREFKKVEQARTLDEVDRRIYGLVAKLRQRGCHPEVLKYCTREFMSEDYFHGILEAAKGVCQHLREVTGLSADGAELITASFCVKHPTIAFNTLVTESEQSEQKGISSLFLGCHQFLRNPRAHAPRKLWHDEVNVLDCLTFISLLHRILDQCVVVPRCEP